MLLEYDDWTGVEINYIFKRFGHTNHPMACFFQPNGKSRYVNVYPIDAPITGIPTPHTTTEVSYTALLYISVIWIGAAWYWKTKTATAG